MGIFDIIEDFVDDPVGTVADIALQPVRDSIDILDGLTDGEIRECAIVRLGADYVAGMALSEVIDYLRK